MTTAAPHPMVPVPEALTTVLGQTALSLLVRRQSSSSDQQSRCETIALSSPNYASLMGRVLAEDAIVNEPYPSFDASIMDGYAVQSGNFTSSSSRPDGWTHRIVDKIYAGDEQGSAKVDIPDSGDATAHQLPVAAYITTGAVVPPPYDTVVPIEECTVSSRLLRINAEPSSVISGKWIRAVGCDMAQHSVALKRGTVLEPSHVGILIQAGVSQVKVERLPRVGVLSTGNELLHEPSRVGAADASTTSSTATGKIPDVNRPILLTTLSEWNNCIPVDLGIATDDDLDGLSETLRSAVNSCDVVVTTGGISMGEKDVLEDAFVGGLGARVHFGRIHMKPGKPTTFMTIGGDHVGTATKSQCLVFALPGNPVSAVVCSNLFVRPCLDMLCRGVDPSLSVEHAVQDATVHSEVVAALMDTVKLDVERPEYRRVGLSYVPGVDGGRYLATSTGVQRSSRLMSMSGADGLMVLPKGERDGKSVAKEGESYPVLLLRDYVGGVKLRDSVHVSGPKLAVGIIHICDSEDAKVEAVARRIGDAIGRDKFRVVGSTSMHSSGGTRGLMKLLDSPTMKESDVVVIVSTGIPFQINLDIASSLRSILEKESDAIALQARKGAAFQHGAAALFEVVAGYVAQMKAMVLFLPEEGSEGALANVRGLLPHGLSISKGLNGKQHHHGHGHSHGHAHGHGHHGHVHDAHSHSTS